MRASTRALIAEVAARHGVDPAEIVGRTKPRLLLAARIEVAKELEARGYWGSQIARVLGGRDHTTIYYYLGRTAKKPRPKPPKPPKPVKPVRIAPERPVRYAGWDIREMLR
jgi:hypothetical protein